MYWAVLAIISRGLSVLEERKRDVKTIRKAPTPAEPAMRKNMLFRGAKTSSLSAPRKRTHPLPITLSSNLL